MNVSLVLLLVVFVSTCHGKEQDGPPPSGILSTTKWQKKVETPRESSCPALHDIEPCECSTETGELVMDCSNVEDEEQLRQVFMAFFPVTEFDGFEINNNYALKVLENGVFGDVSFRSFNMYLCGLETVESDALAPSLSTLTFLWIEICSLQTFPFERLAEFTSLEYLNLFSNKIHNLPPLSSSSLQYLSLSYNAITELTPDVFKLLPAIESIHLHTNYLTEIANGTFTGLPKLAYVDLSENSISYLEDSTFEVVSSNDYTIALDLDDNNIEYVEEDAFEGVAGFANISMVNNALTTLPEEVWRPVLEKTIDVSLAGNDLECECDVAWLVRDPQLLTLVSDARCADGTLLTDLSSADFDMCD